MNREIHEIHEKQGGEGRIYRMWRRLCQTPVRLDEQQSNQVTKKKELLWLHRFTREATAIRLDLGAKS
jgi:hypothetical protein